MSKTSVTLDNLARYPLLSAEEEIICARAVQKMQLLLESSPSGPYSRSDMKTLRHGQRAKDRMIVGNMRWVFALARKYLPLAVSLTFDDLVQEGTIGLIRGVEKFDPGRGYKFSTYSYWWVRQGINRGLANDRIIRLPSNAGDLLRKIYKFKSYYSETFQKAPTIDEIAEHCSMTKSSVKLLLQRSLDTASLDQRTVCADSETSSIGELIPSDGETPLEFAESLEIQEWLDACLGKIDEELRIMVNLRWGLDNRKPMSFSDMARELDPTNGQCGHDVSRRRISSGYSKAMKQLHQMAT